MLYTPPEMHPPPSPGFMPAIWNRESMAVSRDTAESLGAHIITVASPDAAVPEGGLVLNPRPDPDMGRLRKVEAAFLQDNPAMQRVESIPLGQYAQDELVERLGDGPLVLAYRGAHRGFGKYLIEDAEQWSKVFDFAGKHPGLGLTDDFEVRPFVHTPGERFASYRVVVTPTGGVLSSRLFVSGHDQYSDRRIISDRTVQTTGRFAMIQDAFERPDSDYFLNSRDVRSNAGGGYGIHLSGGLDRTRHYVDAKRQRTLEALGIDPEHIATPSEVIDVARRVGTVCGRELDIALGVDVLHGGLYLEQNPGCGAGPQWSPTGEPGLDCFVNMRTAALRELAFPAAAGQSSL